MIFDNVEHSLRSATLSSVVTTTAYFDRILGKTEDKTVPQKTLFLVTGNNLVIGGDLTSGLVLQRDDFSRPTCRSLRTSFHLLFRVTGSFC